jgi:hypothetical protein
MARRNETPTFRVGLTEKWVGVCDGGLVDRAMFRHRLIKQTFKPTNTMNDQTGTQAPAQAGIEDFNGIFQERLRGIVREGLLLMFEQEVTALCGETYRPSESVYRRAGNEPVTIQTTSGKECISKRRVCVAKCCQAVWNGR